MGPEAEAELVRLHARVLFEVDAAERLVAVNEAGPEDLPPRLFLARTRTSQIIWFRTDVSGISIAACAEVARELPAWNGYPSSPEIFGPLHAVVAAAAPITRVWQGVAFCFGDRFEAAYDADVRVIDEASAHLLARYFPRTSVRRESPVVGAVVDGSVVSACFSARQRAEAAEAGVETAEPYRNQGLATMVVSIWRDAVESEGRRPLYSTSWNNLPSLAVARKLKLAPYAETFSLT